MKKTNLKKVQKMNSFVDTIYHYWSVLIGLLIAFIIPILPSAFFIGFLFSLDIIFGWLKNRKENGERFSRRKVWRVTVPRLIVSLIAIICSHELDKYAPLTSLQLAHFMTWFVMVDVMISILINASRVTNWTVIKTLISFLENQKNINLKTKKDEQ